LTTLSSHAFPSVCRLALYIALKLLMPDAGIKYPELDQGGRFAVWRNFFELAGCRVGSSDAEFDTLEDEVATIAPEDVQDLAEKLFNGSFFLPLVGPFDDACVGRTIKNLVRTAQALALSS
jgi:hypothetical protein